MTSAPQIPTVTLPAGHTMPMVAFGTWQLRGEEAYDGVRRALDAGYRHLDTAAFYRNECIGRRTAPPRRGRGSSSSPRATTG